MMKTRKILCVTLCLFLSLGTFTDVRAERIPVSDQTDSTTTGAADSASSPGASRTTASAGSTSPADNGTVPGGSFAPLGGTAGAISGNPEAESDKLILRGLTAEKSPLSQQMELQPPSLKALITITSNLDPFQLDAAGSRTISLKDVLQQAANQNLDIVIR